MRELPPKRKPSREDYERPGHVVDDSQRSFDEKRRVLEDWIQDEEALMTADDEGMTGIQRPHLREALLALDLLLQRAGRAS